MQDAGGAEIAGVERFSVSAVATRFSSSVTHYRAGLFRWTQHTAGSHRTKRPCQPYTIGVQRKFPPPGQWEAAIGGFIIVLRGCCGRSKRLHEKLPGRP